MMEDFNKQTDDNGLEIQEADAISLKGLKNSVVLSFFLVLILWLAKLTENFFHLNLSSFGLLPRDLNGLMGIVFTPFIHSDLPHLLSNSLPLFVLGAGLFFIYKNIAFKVILLIYFFGGLGVWIFARPVYHIGASGLLYGFVSFIFFSGLFRRDPRSISLALLVTFLYGSMAWGVLPLIKGVSWESHLSGAIVGILCAHFYKKKVQPYADLSEDDEESEFYDDEFSKRVRDYPVNL